MGKKLGIISLVCALIFTLICIIAIVNKPVIPDEIYELMLKDNEEAMEKMEEINNNASMIFKVADKTSSIFLIATIILSIVAFVKMVKEHQKGKIMPILSIIIVILMYFITMFNVVDMSKTMDASMKYVQELESQE